MKIRRNLIIDQQPAHTDPTYVFYLNGVRCFIDFGASLPRVHVGTEMARYSLMNDVTDKDLERFVLLLIQNDHGSIKVNMDNPNIKQFLKVTKCI